MYRLTYQDGDTPQSFTFASGEVVIGRSPDCQIVLRDFGISRNHAVSGWCFSRVSSADKSANESVLPVSQ